MQMMDLFKTSTAPMIVLFTYKFKCLDTGKFYLKNILKMLTQKNYMNQNKSVLVLTYYL